MGTDHRGRATGNNHRPTPRLAYLLANKLNDHISRMGVIDSARDAAHTSQILNMTPNWQPAYVHPDDIQESLDSYRRIRDAAGKEGAHPHTQSILTNVQNDLNRAISDRKRFR